MRRRQFLALLATAPIAAACARLAPQSPAVRPEAAEAGPVTYFLDPGGDDSADGLSERTAWRSLGKVTGRALQPGDAVLLRRGGQWSGGISIAASGEEGQPIRFGTYGSGPRPIIDGEHAENPIVGQAVQYVRLEGLELANGVHAGALFQSAGFIEVIDVDAHHAGNDNLIFIDDCHDCSVTGGGFHDSQPTDPTVTSTGIEIADGGERFIIDGADVFGNPTGISIHNHAHEDGDTLLPTDVTIRAVSVRGSLKWGILVNKQAESPDPAVRIEDTDFVGNDVGVQLLASPGLAPVSGVTVCGGSFAENRADVFGPGSEMIRVGEC